ncbi:MAG: MBL fold metallo-hydrolase, partial [Pseudomonadota bacterium]
MFARALASCALLALHGCAPSEEITHPIWSIAGAGEAGFAEQCEPWDDWDKPADPFRVHGNTYYVGTCGISALLIVGEKSHFLLDTGTETGADVVLENIRKLGVEPLEIFAVGYSHEHFDHVGGMAKVIEVTGA